MTDGLRHILQVTPTSYSHQGVIGGGEKFALYVDSALQAGATADGVTISTTLLALDGRQNRGAGRDPRQAIIGRAWDPFSIDGTELRRRLQTADIVYIHQCLTPVGMFVAAHARLLGKKLFGSDAGAGEAALLRNNPDVTLVYDGLHAISAFAATAYREFNVPVHIIAGPVDTAAFPPSDNEARDPSLVVSLGRVLPHKGYERTIQALPETMRLIIVGQHYDREYLAYLSDLAKGREVEFQDDLDDDAVQALLARAGLFVHASTHRGYRGTFYQKPELLGLAPLEAISTGLTTLVSNAAALGELGVLPGCHVFETDEDLANLMQAASTHRLASVPPGVMHNAVTERYGLRSVGRRLLAMMEPAQELAVPCAS